jgi:hypothetical protein
MLEELDIVAAVFVTQQHVVGDDIGGAAGGADLTVGDGPTLFCAPANDRLYSTSALTSTTP